MHADIPDSFLKWYHNLKPTSSKDPTPPKGVISASLAVLDRLRENYVLLLDEHTTPGNGQIRTSGEAVKEVLAKFGETRHYTSEGGRTNRGSLSAVKLMLKALVPAHLETMSGAERDAVLERCQAFLVEKVREYHNRQRLKITYTQAASTWHLIKSILDTADETGKAGPVAQHLVGAKLQLRFPDLNVMNEGYQTADQQTQRPGDFLLGDTAFHVTVAPMTGLYDKCGRNAAEGYKVYILVPDRRLQGARQNVELAGLADRVTVESLESFISQNVEELSSYMANTRKIRLIELLQIYNQRVDDVEYDKSLMIDLPNNLR